jgi:glycosyltransferase involved in cell wall biosynthesis
MEATKVPKISVVITCYNCGNYVGEAIRSVARQTLPGFECVIVDDASTDDSLTVIRQTVDELGDARFAVIALATNLGQTGASRAGLKHSGAPFVCFLDADDVWSEHFLERHLAAHMNETYAVGFSACNARIIDGDGTVLAGAVYWFGQDRSESERDREFVALDMARVPAIDPHKGIAWQQRGSWRLYTRRSLQWVWVSTSSMMFRRALVELVFPADDEAFRLHMDFYLVIMAQLAAGSLLIDDPLYCYRLHGRNFAASNPVLGGRLHLAPRDLRATYDDMLDRMRAALLRDRQRFEAAVGADQYREMVQAMEAAPPATRREPGLLARLATRLFGRPD